uniref:Uncharacterized protein n=3 Tax=Canis lupus TaxID=9612 RepID=A0A8C0S6F3_CANLF
MSISTGWGLGLGRLHAFPERLAARGLRQVHAGAPGPGGLLTKDLCAREFEALRGQMMVGGSQSMDLRRP